MPKKRGSVFQNVGLNKIQRSPFNLSHEKKLTFSFGEIVPIMCVEVNPGETFKLTTEMLARLQPMISPVMHRVNIVIESYFTPTRLVWNESEDFFTKGREGTTSPVVPYATINTTTAANGNFEVGTLADYLGLPRVLDSTVVTDPVNVSVLPFRVYQLIWEEYFRDRNLVADLDFSKNSGNMTGVDFETKLNVLRKSAYRKDYFTSALPEPQRGPDVTIPIEGEGDVTYLDNSIVKDSTTGTPVSTDNLLGTDNSATAGSLRYGDAAMDTTFPGRVENIDQVTVDQVATTIRDFRIASKLQEWYELSMRVGSRYIEHVWGFFRQKSSDARLQRPEFLGGASNPFMISEVLSTVSDVNLEVPQGNMAGHGYSVSNLAGFGERTFEEHGFIMTVVRVLPEALYSQGIERMWTRFDVFDYLYPQFANVGEQDIKNREIWYDGTGAAGANNNTWGYQQRYCEYKYMASTIHGEMRSNMAQWTAARFFTAQPGLNEDFITVDPADADRIFAVQAVADFDQVIMQCYHNLKAIRPLPYYDVPRI